MMDRPILELKQLKIHTFNLRELNCFYNTNKVVKNEYGFFDIDKQNILDNRELIEKIEIIKNIQWYTKYMSNTDKFIKDYPKEFKIILLLQLSSVVYF